MSEWTSPHDIMQDLSVAQGRVVPASLETFGSTEPPVVNIEEDTEAEAEYYKTYGDTDFSTPPDYILIKEMLTMVTNESESTKNILNGDLNSLICPEIIPEREFAIVKPRTVRNVAMSSILESLNKSLLKQPLKSSINMFKKKKEIPNEKIMITNNKPSHSDTVRNNNNGGKYTPSLLANEYYNKYLLNAKHKQQLKEDIWMKAEKQMQEIDERNKQTSCSSSPNTTYNNVSIQNSTGRTDVGFKLLCHRHLLLDSVEDCLVCNVTAKHGYDLNSFQEKLDVQELTFNTISQMHKSNLD